VLPPLMFTLPTSWNNAISQYLPSNAGRQLFALQQESAFVFRCDRRHEKWTVVAG